MDFFVWQRTVVDEAGNVLPSASVSVTDVISGALTQLYSDEGVTAVGNPITADSNGFVQFYVKSGIYTVVATSGADTRTWTKEAIGAPYKRTAAEVSAGITPTNYQYEPGDVRRYGTNTTPGTTDMRAAIQAAFNSGHSVTFEAEQTYAVSDSGGTVSVNGSAYRYATLARAGMRVNCNGATIKLLNAQNTSPIMCFQVDDVQITNLVIDSNRANQTTPATGEMAGITAYDCDRLDLSKIKAVNNRQYAGRFLNCRFSRFVDLHCEDSYGDGWGFGTSGAVAFELFDSFIDRAYAQDCEGTFAGLEGNGIILTLIDSEFGTIAQKDCHGGIKLQNTSHDVVGACVRVDGDDQTFGSANSGFKVQGFAAGSLYPYNINVAAVISTNNYGNGLVLNTLKSVTIDSYMGRLNGSGSSASGSDRNDVEINMASNDDEASVKVGHVTVDTPDGVGLRNQGTGNVVISDILVRNPTGPAVQDTSSGTLVVGEIRALDDTGVPNMTYAFHQTGSAKGRVDRVVTNLTHSTTQTRVLLAAAGNYDFEIGEIRLGSSDPLHPVVQLTNASATTSLANGHIFRQFVGGSADYFHPLTRVQPWDASARALSGQFGAVITDSSSGTGATLQHPTAGANDFVQVTVGPWKIVSQAQS